MKLGVGHTYSLEQQNTILKCLFANFTVSQICRELGYSPTDERQRKNIKEFVTHVQDSLRRVEPLDLPIESLAALRQWQDNSLSVVLGNMLFEGLKDHGDRPKSIDELKKLAEIRKLISEKIPLPHSSTLTPPPEIAKEIRNLQGLIKDDKEGENIYELSSENQPFIVDSNSDDEESEKDEEESEEELEE